MTIERFAPSDESVAPHLAMWRRYRRLKRLKPLLYCGTAVPFLLFCLAARLHFPLPPDSVTFYLVVGLGIAIRLGIDGVGLRRQRSLIHLIEVEDIRQIDMLLELLQETWDEEDSASDRQVVHKIQTGIRATLLRMLPQLETADALSLSDKLHTLLQQHLSSKPRLGVGDVTLHIAILKVLEAVGNQQDLHVVERIAAGRIVRPWPIKEAAQACAAALQAKQNQQQMQTSLLRASEEPAAPSQNLLRPASGSAEASRQQLLRPSASGETVA